MKDFKNSFEQRMWESAAESHARAEKMLNLLATMTGVEKHREYWVKARELAEKNYPALRKPASA